MNPIDITKYILDEGSTAQAIVNAAEGMGKALRSIPKSLINDEDYVFLNMKHEFELIAYYTEEGQDAEALLNKYNGWLNEFIRWANENRIEFMIKV